MSGHSSGPRGVWCQLLQQLLLGLLAAASLINTCHADSSSVATDCTGERLVGAQLVARTAVGCVGSSTAPGTHLQPGKQVGLSHSVSVVACLCLSVDLTVVL